MKRDEQTQIMRKKILKSAITEFNEKDYEKASLNHICKIGHISKGIIYHYFTDKDELYLECLRMCYDELKNFYIHSGFMLNSTSLDIQDYMKVRMSFFEQHQEYQGLFFNGLLRSPKHLKKDIKNITKSLDEINRVFYHQYLQKLTLRKNITVDNVIQYLDTMQKAFNDNFREKLENGRDFQDVIKEHEKMIPEWIDLILYGIAQEDEK